jgi:hypothetical protein
MNQIKLSEKKNPKRKNAIYKLPHEIDPKIPTTPNYYNLFNDEIPSINFQNHSVVFGKLEK